MSISCSTSADCPFQYSCISNNICQHDPLLPPSVYSAFVYTLFPFLAMFCNMGGIAIGIIKVPILQSLLNWSARAASPFSATLSAAAAFPNFIMITLRRHEITKKVMVDYNMVLIIIPTLIYGTRLGSIINKYMPQIARDVIYLITFITLTHWFFTRLTNFKPPVTLQQNFEQEFQKSTQRRSINIQMLSVGSRDFKDQGFRFSRNDDRRVTDIVYNPKETLEDIKHRQERERIQAYERTMHWRQIFMSLVVFAVFETLSYLAVGTIVQFDTCTSVFIGAFLGFNLFWIIYIIGLFYYTKRKLARLREIKYPYDIPIDNLKSYLTLMGMCFLGGLLQGILGVGAGNCTVAALLALGLEPKSAAATTGYTVLFAALTNLVNNLVNKKITAQDFWFLFGITSFFGGLLTYAAYRFLNKRPYANKYVLGVLLGLCIMAVLGCIPNTYFVLQYQGFESLTKVPPFC